MTIANVTKLVTARIHAGLLMIALVEKSVLAANAGTSVPPSHFAPKANYAPGEPAYPGVEQIMTVQIQRYVGTGNVKIHAKLLMPVVQMPSVKLRTTGRYVYAQTGIKEIRTLFALLTSADVTKTVKQTRNVELMALAGILAWSKGLVALTPSVELSTGNRYAPAHLDILGMV